MPRFAITICAGVVAAGLLAGFAQAMEAAAPRAIPQAPLLALTETVEARPTETPIPTNTPPPTETPPPTTPPETPPPTTPPETPPPTTPPETPPPTGTPVQDQQQTATPTPTETPVATPTLTPTIPAPVALPGTGESAAGGISLIVLFLALIVAAGGLMIRSRRV